jgi:V8-like Glu-specific endopeptidase
MAGYPGDKRLQLMGDKSCRVLDQNGKLALTDCDVHFGSSGGPLLVRDNDTLKVAGVLAGFYIDQGSAAVLTSSWPDTPLTPQCP